VGAPPLSSSCWKASRNAGSRYIAIFSASGRLNALPGDEGPEHGRVAEIALAHDRPRGDLRDGLLHQIAELGEGLVVEVGLARMARSASQVTGRPLAWVDWRRSSTSSSLTAYIPPE